jgi:hypothetical protein
MTPHVSAIKIQKIKKSLIFPIGSPEMDSGTGAREHEVDLDVGEHGSGSARAA